MAEVEIVWPAPAELMAKPDRQYVDVHRILDRCALRLSSALAAKRKPRNVLLNSKHGLGKTLMVASLAERMRMELSLQIPMITFDCSEDTREYHLKGSFTVQPNGATAFVPGPIPLAIEMANQTGLSILCLEEISALTPGAQKVINAITDWRSGVYIPQIGRNIRLQPGAHVLVMGTMNPTVYGGVFALNADLRSRFVEEAVPWPDMKQEAGILKEICPFASGDTIESVVQLGKESRATTFEYNLSTRDLVTLLEELHDMPAMKEAVLFCVANKFEGNEKDTMADRIDGIFKTKVKKLLAA